MRTAHWTFGDEFFRSQTELHRVIKMERCVQKRRARPAARPLCRLLATSAGVRSGQHRAYLKS
eukprot:6214779-Pleurochrysis_carterae.AAC.2